MRCSPGLSAPARLTLHAVSKVLASEMSHIVHWTRLGCEYVDLVHSVG
jgi:hypothetical protein